MTYLIGWPNDIPFNMIHHCLDHHQLGSSSSCRDSVLASRDRQRSGTTFQHMTRRPRQTRKGTNAKNTTGSAKTTPRCLWSIREVGQTPTLPIRRTPYWTFGRAMSPSEKFKPPYVGPVVSLSGNTRPWGQDASPNHRFLASYPLRSWRKMARSCSNCGKNLTRPIRTKFPWAFEFAMSLFGKTRPRHFGSVVSLSGNSRPREHDASANGLSFRGLFILGPKLVRSCSNCSRTERGL